MSRTRPAGRDTPVSDRSGFLGALAAVPGFVMGLPLAYLFSLKYGAPGWVLVLTPFSLAVVTAALAMTITGRVGAAGATLYNPSGRSTPPKKEYSYAESLVARGAYEEAVTAFELAVAEDGTDPVPYLRIARIYRDHLSRPDDAARWFRRALRESAVAAAPAFAVRKELVELYVQRMAEPARAAPELARMAEEYAGTPQGEWTARELAEVKARIGEGRTGG